MSVTRRRFFSIAAAGSIAGLAALTGRRPAAARVVWRGTALGASASIVLDGSTAAEADLHGVLQEIERLENLFSLYRSDSVISVLNRTGRVDRPDPDFLALLSAAERIYLATDGAFDPTIQSAWSQHARAHSGSPDANTSAPCPGWRNVRFDTASVWFSKPGMAITLNGIAQGYITDRVALLLKDAGLDHVLVDIGELRAIGPRADQSPWPVRIAADGSASAPREVRLMGNRALAVSYSHGTTFDQGGQYGHIMVPDTGEPMTSRRLVAIEAPTATLADALSTALCTMTPAKAATVQARFPTTWLESNVGSVYPGAA